MTEPTVHCDVCKSEIKPDSDGVRRYFRQRDYNVARDSDYPGWAAEWVAGEQPAPEDDDHYWSDVCGIGCLYRLLSAYNSAMQQARMSDMVGNGCERVQLEAVDLC